MPATRRERWFGEDWVPLSGPTRWSRLSFASGVGATERSMSARDADDRTGGRLRAMQKEALHQMHAQLLHRLELLGALDSLRDHHRVVVVDEANHCLHEVLL